MLIEKKNLPEINDIICTKLVSGEEIIGRLTDQNIDSITLAKPLSVVFQPISASQMGVSYVPVMGSADPDTNLVVPKSAMTIRPAKVSAAAKSNYIEMTAGLITPGKGGIIS